MRVAASAVIVNGFHAGDTDGGFGQALTPRLARNCRR